MSSSTTLAPASADTVRRASVLALAGVEARRNLRSPVFVVGLLFSCLIAENRLGVFFGDGADWSAGTYADLPLYFVPLAGGTFLLGLRAASRDHRADVAPLGEDCPIDETVRTAGRLLGLAVFVVLAAAGVLLVEVASWIEGGYWIGAGLWRTDSAHHTPFELLQPIVLVAFAGAAGVAAGRRFQHHTPLAVLGGALTILTTYVSWAFQWPPLLVVSLVQTQPIGRVVGPAPYPDHWFVSFDTYELVYFRQYVDHALIGGHVLYLVGLTALCVGSALRSRRRPWVTEPPTHLRRRLRWTGWLCVAGGILIQLWAIGFVLTPGGTGEGQLP